MGVALSGKHFFGFNDLLLKGNLLFAPGSGKGLLFANLAVKDNSNTVTLNSSGKTQLLDFDIGTIGNGVTPVIAQNHVLVDAGGTYLVGLATHVNNNAAQSHVIDVSVWTNNGATEILSAHGHRNLTGGAGDVASLSGIGLAILSTGDTVEVWSDTGDAGDRAVTFSDVSLILLKMR